MSRKTRERILTASQAYAGYVDLYNPNWSYHNAHSPSLLTSTQVTESEDHLVYRLGKTNEDIGGEFFSQQVTYEDNIPYLHVTENSDGTGQYYKGKAYPFLAYWPTGVEQFFPVQASSQIEIDALGTTAIARVLPTNPVASLAVALGELREGFPKIIGSSLFKEQVRYARKAGDEYLNVEFGWKTMIADMMKWAHAYRNADKIYSQFRRDSGRRVRRRYVFPKLDTIVKSEVLSRSLLPGPQHGGVFSDGNTVFPCHVEHRLIRERWFSGAFTYYLAGDSGPDKEWDRHAQRLNKLYGTKVTPEVVWNLAPWSWAVDWFSNAGDVVHNVTQFSQDGLVMPYGYMMEKSILRAQYSIRDIPFKSGVVSDLTQVFTNTVKTRRRATPFGFGLSDADLTDRQLAIIAALGLSRSR
jgi:hypothetical protein